MTFDWCCLAEVITVEICLENPMSIPLLLLDVRLLWSFLAHAPDCSETPGTPLLVTNENHTNKVGVSSLSAYFS